MKVRRLEMKSFRGFRELTLEFKGQLTVLVGVNGAGKTSILDCLALLLSQVNSRVRRREDQARQLSEADIQSGEAQTLNTIEVVFEEQSFRWSLAHVRTAHPQQVSSDLTGLEELVSKAQAKMEIEHHFDGQWKLPLAVYYPVDRVPAPNAPIHVKTGWKPSPTFFDAYDEALEKGGLDFKLFFQWFREREDLENEERLQVDPAHRDARLEAVRTAIEKLVPDFKGLRVQRAPLRMVVQKKGALLELDQLSDGEKGLLALAGDLARRLATANPYRDDPLSAEAVVMIDEIELHLHPGWQRMVVERLCQTFPNCQFIVTTHSPQVLSQVPAESVVLLDRFQRVDLPAGTLGRDSNSILAEVMGVPERPQASIDRIHEIARMIDAEDLPRARQALDELARQLGEQDSEVVRLRALIGFLGG